MGKKSIGVADRAHLQVGCLAEGMNFKVKNIEENVALTEVGNLL